MENFADGVHLVQVTTDLGEYQLWVAATLREEAVMRVLGAIPAGWTASLLEAKLKPAEVKLLRLKPGEVRELVG
jgi:hypothetical protein